MLEISFGKNRSDTNWKPEYMEWPELVENYLLKVRRTSESMAEYDVMSKDNKDNIKNGRAFVGGFVKGGRRKKENIENRYLITLDADNANEDFLFDVDLNIGGFSYVVYSTHSSRPGKLKYRVVLPTNRVMTPDEYSAVSRKIAHKIGMLYFDRTTFEVHRLMYLPSCSKDAKPEFILGEGSFIDVDAVLAEYEDWHDTSEWPRHPDEIKKHESSLKKLVDPTEKPGVIGVFCKIYSIQEGIDAFIPGTYIPTTSEDRWTYSGGTSFGGMRVYDNAWAYSEHQSDPANDGHCHNVFDIIRIHKFGGLDEDAKEDTPINKLLSYGAMLDFAAKDPRVKVEWLEKAQSDFADDLNFNDEDWQTNLELDPRSRKGKPLQTPTNSEIILRNGPFKGILAYDDFGNTEVIKGDLPWRKKQRSNQGYEPWLGSDDKRLQHYLGKLYEFKASTFIQNAFTEVVHSNSFHPIKEWLESLAWDGIERADRLFINYLGAEDTHYVRTVTRKMLVAAVKRLYEPGCKFDEMLVLVGPQGSHKSSLLEKIGRKWFSASLKTFDNKEAGEQLQSAWIFELGELAAMKRSEIEEIKAFLSKTEDRYRVAYDRQVSDFPRKCVFFGTTNNNDFLYDPTGNRRFWPVDINPNNRILSHWDSLTDDVVGQIWAEALNLYNLGETLLLDKVAAKEAERMQTLHTEIDPREGIIIDWLESPLDSDFSKKECKVYRNRVCAAMVWEQCLGNSKGTMKVWDARDIYNILRHVPGWVELKKRAIVPGYGQQTAFDRMESG